MTAETKALNDNLKVSSVSYDNLRNDLLQVNRNSIDKFNSISHTFIKYKFFYGIAWVITVVFLLIAIFYLNTLLNKNVRKINASIDELNKRHAKITAELKENISGQLSDNMTFINKRIREINEAFDEKLSQANHRSGIALADLSNMTDNKISASKDNASAMIREMKISLQEEITKSEENLKPLIDKQLAAFKNDFFSELAKLKADVNDKFSKNK